MINYKSKSIVSSLSSTKIIAFVENALKLLKRSKEMENSDIKLLSIFDSKAYFINDVEGPNCVGGFGVNLSARGSTNKLEHGLRMISICRYKH